MNPYSTLGTVHEDTINGTAGSLVFSADLVQASLLDNYGLKVREFIVLSFLSDEGPMDVGQLARVVNIDTQHMVRSVERLAEAGLVMRPSSAGYSEDSFVILSGEGSEVASLINEQA